MSSALVTRALEDVRKRHRKLTPGVVVQDATSSDHPLHPYFTWDDSKAGHRWRLEEARNLIRSVKVVVTVEHKKIEVPAYVSRSTKVSSYVPINEIAHNQSRSRTAIVAECVGARGHLLRARALAIALGLESAFDQLITAVSETEEVVAEQINRQEMTEEFQASV